MNNTIEIEMDSVATNTVVEKPISSPHQLGIQVIMKMIFWQQNTNTNIK